MILVLGVVDEMRSRVLDERGWSEDMLSEKIEEKGKGGKILKSG